MQGICRGCNLKKDLVDAHVIPESFFKEIDTPGQTSILIEGSKESYLKRRPKGIYDQNILCLDCEKIFQGADDYAQILLLKSIDKRKELISKKGKIIYYENFNYKLLKRFVISLIWRASISIDVFFSHINLGPFESRAKELLWSDSIGKEDEFDFFFSFLTNLPKNSILQPVNCRFGAINVCRFYLGEILLFVKVDKRKFDPNPILARDGKPLYFVSSYENEHRVLKEALSIVGRSNTPEISLKVK